MKIQDYFKPIVGKLLIAALLLFTACQRPESIQEQPTYEATVLRLGFDCKLPLIDFSDKADDVAQLTGNSGVYRVYYAINLDSTYWKAGTALKVTIRKVTANESPVCTTMGIGYPAVAIVSAEAN